MKDTTMKWLLSVNLVLFSWSLVLALQAIHVADPAEQEQEEAEQQPTQQPPRGQHPNTTFFLSVIPVQEPIRDDVPPPPSPSTIVSSMPPRNSQWSDKSKSEPTTNGSVKSESNIYEQDDTGNREGGGGFAGEEEKEDTAGQKTAAHDHFSGLLVNNQQRPKSFSLAAAAINQQEVPVRLRDINRDESHSSTLRSITASSSVIVDGVGHNHHQPPLQILNQQRESEFHGEKEFSASPQLGQWSDEHDFKRLLTENDNVFYPMRPQPASIKSTSFIGHHDDHGSDYDKSKFINEIPAPKFHSTADGNHLSHSSLAALNKQQQHLYPKFNDFIRTQANTRPPLIDIPQYVHRESPENAFHLDGQRTPHLENSYPGAHPDSVRVQPLHGATALPMSMSEPKHSSHRSTTSSFIHSPQPDHPYTFDFGHGESSASSTASKPPALEFHDLNEYEKFPAALDHHLLQAQHHHHHHHQHLMRHGHGPRHGPPGHWKKIVHVLAAAIPLGLVISALTPHVVLVSPNDTSIEAIKKHPAMLLKPYPPPPLPHPSFITYYPRWRALMENSAAAKENLEFLGKDNSSLTEFLTELSNSLTEIPGVELCEDRAFCEMARMGAEKGAKEHHKMLWRIANETTESQIRKAGMKHIFRAIKEGRCGKIKCKKS